MVSLRKACDHGHFSKHWLNIPDPTGTGPDIAWPECSFEPTNDDLIAALAERKAIIDLWEAPDPHNQPSGVVVLFEGEFSAQRVNAETPT